MVRPRPLGRTWRINDGPREGPPPSAASLRLLCPALRTINLRRDARRPLLLVLSVLVLVCAPFARAQFLPAGITGDVLLSQENSPSTLLQDSPRLFALPSGFACAWNDARGGDEGTYAQNFDPLGHPVGHNYPSPAIEQSVISSAGRLLAISSETSMGWPSDFPDILTITGTFHSAAGMPIDTAILASVMIPWCGTGYLGDDFDCAAIGEHFFFLMRNDGSMSAAEYNGDGDLLYRYPDSTFPWHAAATASIAGLTSGHTIVLWHEYDPYTFRGAGIFASFIDPGHNVVVNRLHLAIPLDSVTPGYWWINRKWLKAVSLGDSAFLVIAFSPPPQRTLYLQKFDRSGTPLTGVDSLAVHQRPGLDACNLLVSSNANGLFHLLLSTSDYTSGVSVNELFTFTTSGDLVGPAEIDSSGPAIVGNFMIRTADSLLRVATAKSGDVFLTTLRGLSEVSSVRINDDSVGSNEVSPRVCPADDGRIFFSWNDEEKSVGRFTDPTVALMGDPVRLEGTGTQAYAKTPGFFTDGSIVSLWSGTSGEPPVAGFAFYDAGWNLMRRDTLGGLAAGYALKGLSVRSDSTFLVIAVGGTPPSTEFMMFGRSGTLLADTVVLGSWTGNLQNEGQGSFTAFLVDYSSSISPNRALTYSLVLALEAERPVRASGTPIGHQRVLQISNAGYSAYGTIVSFDGDTVAASVYLFGPGAVLAGVGAISPDTVLVAYKLGAAYFAKAYSDDGVQLGDSVRVHEATTGSKKDLAFAVRDGKIYFAWSEVRPPALGYSVFASVLEISRLVGVDEPAEPALPADYVLAQNFPNPFNPTTTIRYALPAAGHVTLNVYNLLGQLVSSLVDRDEEPGWHDVNLDARPLATGVYTYRLSTGGFSAIRKMLLVR